MWLHGDKISSLDSNPSFAPTLNQRQTDLSASNHFAIISTELYKSKGFNIKMKINLESVPYQV